MPLKITSWKAPLAMMKIVALILIGILILGIYIGTESSNPRPSSTRILDLNKKVDLTDLDLPKSKYILLGFWATWCPTCKPELKALNQLSKEWNSKDLKIVSVNLNPSNEQSKVCSLWAELNLSLPLISASKSNLLENYLRLFEIEVLPTYVLVKDNEFLILKMDGATDWTDSNIKEQVLKKIIF